MDSLPTKLTPPTFQNNFPWVYYYCDRDPTATETLDDQGNPVLVGYPGFYYMWYNTSSHAFWWCLDNTAGAMVWEQMLSVGDLPLTITNGGTGSSDAASARINLGLNINSSRPYSIISSPDFGIDYSPSLTNDTFVLASIQMANTLSTTTTVTADIDTGSGFETVATIAMSGVAATSIQVVSFIVPLGTTYRLAKTGNGQNTFVSLSELGL